MQEEVFNELADLALKSSGQAIPKSKSYLIEARLAPIARREGFGSMADLVHCLKSRANPIFAAEIAAALVSKDTWFFRDRDCLQRIVEDVLPKRLKASNTGRLKVWCAGGSTGQEAYSLAILLADEMPPALRGPRSTFSRQTSAKWRQKRRGLAGSAIMKCSAASPYAA